MDLSASFYIVAGFVVVLVGISKSGFAGGLGVMAVPLMSLYVPPQFALAVHMPILIAMDLMNGWHYRHDWSRRIVWALLPGALLGLVVGAALFQSFDPVMLKLLIGVVAVFMSLRFFIRDVRPATQRKDWPLWAITLVGAICGFAGLVAHAGGPAIKGYLLAQNMDKTEFVGTNSMFFLFLNAFKAVTYGILALYSWQSVTVSLLLLPCVALGVLLGYYLHSKLNQRLFMRIAYGLLGLAGLRLLWDVAQTLGGVA